MIAHLARTLHTVILIGSAVLVAMVSSTVSLAQDIIVDNRDANTSQNAGWYTSSGPAPYLGNSVYNNRNSGRFTWYPELPMIGDYDVYAWWTYHKNRSDNVPYYIELGTSEVQVNVDHHDPDLGGQWNLLGRFTFSEGTIPEISVSSENGQASADAVKFVEVEKPAHWPRLACPCDEYYSRAISKYVGWGGRLDGGADVMVCDDFEYNVDLDTSYTTNVNGGTVTVRLSVDIDEDNNNAWECSATASGGSNKYARFAEGTDIPSAQACRASVYDFCCHIGNPLCVSEKWNQ